MRLVVALSAVPLAVAAILLFIPAAAAYDNHPEYSQYMGGGWIGIHGRGTGSEIAAGNVFPRPTDSDVTRIHHIAVWVGATATSGNVCLLVKTPGDSIDAPRAIQCQPASSMPRMSDPWWVDFTFTPGLVMPASWGDEIDFYVRYDGSCTTCVQLGSSTSDVYNPGTNFDRVRWDAAAGTFWRDDTKDLLFLIAFEHTPHFQALDIAAQSLTAQGVQGDIRGQNVDSSGLATTARLEWGTTTAYGSQSNYETCNQGSTCWEQVSNLNQHTTYHFRMCGSNSVNSGGPAVSCSQDQTATTNNYVPGAPVLGGPASGFAGNALTFTAAANDPGDTITYQWDWDNSGTVDETSSAFQPSGATESRSHSFAVGTRTFQVRTLDAAGSAGGWTSKTVTIGTPNGNPGAPSNPNPSNGASSVAQTGTLSWTNGVDPEGATVYATVYLDQNTVPTTQICGRAAGLTYCNYSALQGGRTYRWRVVLDDGTGGTSETTWAFSTPNHAPTAAASPWPSPGATNQAHEITAVWVNPGDPDGDSVFTTVYAGVAWNLTSVVCPRAYQMTTCKLPPIGADQTVHWRVVTDDNRGANSEATWTYTTNHLEYIPRGPFPPVGETGVDINSDLTWQNPSPTDRVRVFMGTSTNTIVAVPGCDVMAGRTSCVLAPLAPDTRYFWRIVLEDPQGNVLGKQDWAFITAPSTPPGCAQTQDSDHDGVPLCRENTQGTSDSWLDSNGDGIADGYDSDGDGLSDYVESQWFLGGGAARNQVFCGTDAACSPSAYPLPTERDVYVEIDVMDARRMPRVQDLDTIRTAFANARWPAITSPINVPQGIRLHIDAGTMAGGATSIYNLGGGGIIPATEYLTTARKGLENGKEKACVDIDWAPLDTIKKQLDAAGNRKNFRADRDFIFHYTIFVKHVADGCAWGGVSQGVPGRNLIVSGGENALSGSAYYAYADAAAFLHELGHNMGLHHGGNEGENYKPNYISIMNYQYGADVYEECKPIVCTTPAQIATYNANRVPMDFSHWALSPLDERFLDETAGLAAVGAPDPTESAFPRATTRVIWRCPHTAAEMRVNGATSVNWDCQGTASVTSMRRGIDGKSDDNHTAIDHGCNATNYTTCQVLTGWDDWANLGYDGIGRGWAGFMAPYVDSGESPAANYGSVGIDRHDDGWPVPLPVIPGPEIGVSPGATYCVGTALTFTAPPAGGLTISSGNWDWGDGAETAASPWTASQTHAFTSWGTFVVRLQVTYTSGTSASSARIVEMTECPLPTLSLSPATACAGSSRSFTGAAPAGYTAAWGRWNWGDGSPVTTVNPWAPTTHAFATSGAYHVTLELHYTDGASSTQSIDHTVTACPPAALAFGPSTYCAGSNLSFSATPPSGYAASTARYDWADPSPNYQEINPGTSSVQHAFAAPGTYPVGVLVRHADGSSSTAASNVNVAACPTPNFTWNPTFCVGSPLTFTATAPAGYVPTSANWQWMDGSSPTTVSPWSTTTAHVFTASGTFAVKLTLTYNDGASSFITRNVDANHCPTTVASSPATYCVDSRITFTASSPPGDAPTSGTWTWNDGTPATPVAPWTPVTVHQFPAAGTYLVSLTIIHNDSTQETITKSMTVSGCPLPSLDWSAPKYCVGSRIAFNAYAPSGYTTIAGTMDWGDPSPNLEPYNPWPGIVTHAYAEPGTYNVGVTLEYADGASSTTTRSITIPECPEPSLTFGPATYCVDSNLGFEGFEPSGYAAESGQWSWGDESPAEILEPWIQNVVHPFASPGTYNAVLTMTYTDGAQSSAFTTVLVEPCPPPNFTWYPNAPCTQEEVFFAGYGPTGYTQQYSTWTWDDYGDTSLVEAPGSTSHVFTVPGSNKVRLRMDYEDGSHSERTHVIDVQNCQRTYGAGDRLGDFLYVAGDDPGCGLGDPDSFEPGNPSGLISVTAPGGFVKRWADMPAPKFLAGGAAVSPPPPGMPNFALLAAGGTNDCDFVPSATAFAYDPGSDTWAIMPNMAQPRIAPASVGNPALGGVILLGGDATGGNPSNPGAEHRPTAAVEKFTGTPGPVWTPMTPMPAGLIGAAADYDTGRIYVSGGYGHEQQTSSLVQVYDPTTAKWAGPHLPVASYVAGEGGFSCGGRRWVVGGMQGQYAPMHTYDASLATAKTWSASPTGDWLAGPTLPAASVYPATATVGNNAYIFGGYTGSGTVSSSLYKMTCPATGTGAAVSAAGGLLPVAAPIAVAEAAMEASGPASGTLGTNLLYVFGGSTGVAASSSELIGACPVASIQTIEPSTGLAATLTASLPTATAAMGSAMLSDGRIVLVGGRTSGLTASGTSTCNSPSANVFVFDPTNMSICSTTPLPKGLIGPSVEAYGTDIYVAGGDDRGDVPQPVAGTDPRARHPSDSMYRTSIPTGCTSTGWTSLTDMPLAVARAPMALLGTKLWVMGGNHHPHAAVRLVQSYDIATGKWETTSMPAPLAFHGMESCSGPTLQRMVTGGISAGTLYLSEASMTTYNPMAYGGSTTGWSATGPGYPAAFPVGSSPGAGFGGPYFATGSQPGIHRTDAFAGPMPPC